MEQQVFTTDHEAAADVMTAIEAGDANAEEYDIDQIVRDCFDYDAEAGGLVQTVDEDGFWEAVETNAYDTDNTEAEDEDGEEQLAFLARSIRFAYEGGYLEKFLASIKYRVLAVRDWDGEGWEGYLDSGEKVLNFYTVGGGDVTLYLQVCEADRDSMELSEAEVMVLGRADAEALFNRLTGGNDAFTEDDVRLTAEEFQDVRLVLGFSQQHMADLLKVKRATISHWEMGKYQIPYRVRDELKAIVTIQISQLQLVKEDLT